MKYNFDYKGGIVKYPAEKITSKFLLFHLLPSIDRSSTQEKIFFTSLRGGHIVDSLRHSDPIVQEETVKRFETDNPVFKIFTLVEGFGVQKQFYSFFFTLDIHEREITINPIYKENKDHSFCGKGRFLNREEVKLLLGEDSISYSFYQKQEPLSKSIFRRVVTFKKGFISVNPASNQIRRVRF